jgi:hypothetical protein
MTKSLRVGIIGASSDSRWAKDSHALRCRLAGLELADVVTKRIHGEVVAARGDCGGTN